MMNEVCFVEKGIQMDLDIKKSKPTVSTIIKSQLTLANMMGLILTTIIVVSGAIIFMVMVDWIPLTSENKILWIEINSQILTGIFTITALLSQPVRLMMIYWTYKWFHSDGEDKNMYATKINNVMPLIHLSTDKLNPGLQNQVKAIKTNSDDDVAVNMESCKVGHCHEVSSSNSSVQTVTSFEKPQRTVTPTWKWILILFFLNTQCIFQYPVTYVQWVWVNHPTDRPTIIVGIFVPLSFLSMIISTVWPVLLDRNSKSLK
ncbi:hypothetical protein BC833DRAFT_620215 [Globomyces pollinis-pini]|nr:hypothetical protein BC833DRAFT_620215 [Globomyces pollinis-pini]